MSRALIDKDLRNLVKKGDIRTISGCMLDDYIQPTSIDIPVCDTAYLVKHKFLPFSKKVKDIVDDITLEKISLKDGAILFKGQTYLIPCMKLDLEDNISVKISPKSSIGRIDLLTRAIFDCSGLYDYVAPGSKGQLWIEVSPQSFNVRIKEHLSLNQLRLFKDSNPEEIKSIDFEKTGFLFDDKGNILHNQKHDRNRLILNLSVNPRSLFGYEALPTNEVIDLSKPGKHPWQKFFREIRLSEENNYTLEKDRFYIVTTKENIRVPPEYSMEMVPFFHMVGELRAHYAGFFDPGWGAEKGAAGVLEIRPHETLTVYDGQPICLVEYFENDSIPQKLYGFSGNNYHLQQGPKLAKYFR